ncbi:putative spermidine/putrescine transport system substrate-binding protein [Hydrogenispora ethanolica]|uniref:Putative spermidine/putrescine transport system substrate-binding protein n=1 Tax=Hydrogenispora ethanolica TaxID=1082276 RepID=A0A4R1S7D0_HYDET|nr:ABC transporter substrate-binding protein [Hydrogenispora ethanolica]TCL75149.1 putative spermidine/putrescine transport system substrate-binding protein [Hydrogenispora ethanolica]
MKKIIGLLLGLLVLSCALGVVFAAGEPRTLVVSTWGYNEDQFRKNVFGPFEKENNVKIVLEVGNNGERLNKLKLMKNSSVDVITLAESYALDGAKAGVFEKIDARKIPNLKYLYDVAKKPVKDGYGPAYTMNRTGIIYDAKAVAKPIKSWADLWRPDLKQKITIPDITITSGPAMIQAGAIKAGTAMAKNDSKAFSQLVALKPNVVKIYTKSSDLNNLFIQKEVVVGVGLDFAFPKIKEAIPSAVYVDPKEGSVANRNTINIVKGSKNVDLAYKFIDWWLSEKVQRANALDKLDSPVNKKVVLTEEEAVGLTYGAKVFKKMKALDFSYINGVMPKWIQRWNEEIAD